MGLFDIFTGDPVKEAAEQQRALLQQTLTNQTASNAAAQRAGIEALTSGRTGALDAITSGFGGARSDVLANLEPALAALRSGEAGGRGDLAIGRDLGLSALMSGVTGATGAYDPLMAAARGYGGRATQASNMSADALGLNGPEGIARARAAFQTGPGYEFQLNQGLESVLRNANVSGMAAGGNALREAQTYGSGLANQEFQNWLTNLRNREQLYAPLEQSGLGTAGGGIAQALLTGGTGAANLYSGTAGRLADLASTTGGRIADLYRGTGTTLADLASRGALASADIFGTTGRNLATLGQSYAGLGNNLVNTLTPQISNTYGTEAQAEMQGSANIWNALGNIAKAGVGLPGVGSAIGSGVTSLFGR